MLTFFRRIRKGLLGEGAVPKYLLYAIGEIALVVIGILIALQINNWNEWRKERIIESKFLLEMSENLEFNIDIIDQIIKNFYDEHKSSNIIIAVLEGDRANHDSLNGDWARALNPTSELSTVTFVGFESLNDSGFDYVLNDNLRKEIKRLFEWTYSEAKGRHNRVNQYWPEVKNLTHEHLMRDFDSWSFKPFDIEELKKNKEFRSWVNTIRNNRGWMRSSFEQSLTETQRVLQLIKEELGEE